VCRTSLLPSALKTLAANRGEPLPVRLFELSDVVLLDARRDVGARNERRLLAVHCGRSSDFDVVHGLLVRVMQVLGVPYAGEPQGGGARGRVQEREGLREEWGGLTSVCVCVAVCVTVCVCVSRGLQRQEAGMRACCVVPYTPRTHTHTHTHVVNTQMPPPKHTQNKHRHQRGAGVQAGRRLQLGAQ
jgi:hypothetical protein